MLKRLLRFHATTEKIDIFFAVSTMRLCEADLPGADTVVGWPRFFSQVHSAICPFG